MQQPDVKPYVTQLMTSTRENILKDNIIPAVPKINTTQQKVREEKILQHQAEQGILAQHRLPQVGFLESLLVRTVPMLVTNREGKQANHVAQSFNVTRQRMEDALKANKISKENAMHEYKKKVVTVSMRTAEFNKIYSDGIIDIQTGEYLSDQNGLRGAYEIALIDLDAAQREEKECRLEYFKTLAKEKQIKNSLEAVSAKAQSDTDVEVIFADLTKSLERFNIKDIQKMFDDTSDRASDAVSMIQESNVDRISVEPPELLFDIGDMILPSTANIVNKCKARAKSNYKAIQIQNLEVPSVRPPA